MRLPLPVVDFLEGRAVIVVTSLISRLPRVQYRGSSLGVASYPLNENLSILTRALSSHKHIKTLSSLLSVLSRVLILSWVKVLVLALGTGLLSLLLVLSDEQSLAILTTRSLFIVSNIPSNRASKVMEKSSMA